MAVIYSSDLSSANSSSSLNTLIECSSKAKELSNKIKSFIDSSTKKLKGNGYDAIRKKLSLYVEALEKESIVLENLANGIKTANNEMISYMQGHTELDDSLVPELTNNLDDLKKNLSFLESYTVKEVEVNGEMKEEKIQNGNFTQIEDCKNSITELSKKIELLEGLEGASSGAWSKIGQIEGDINSVKNAVSGLTISTFK